MICLKKGKGVEKLKEKDIEKLEDFNEKIIEIAIETRCPFVDCEECLYGYYDSEAKMAKCMLVKLQEKIEEILEKGKKGKKE